MSNLPIRIMNMVRSLHQQGHVSLYLYSGMSPSGMYWRYSIGLMDNGRWPVDQPLVDDSIGPEDQQLAWARDTGTVETLANAFESCFDDQLKHARTADGAYVHWYDALLNELGHDEVLAFYADYPAPHEHLLEDAPGYTGSVSVLSGNDKRPQGIAQLSRQTPEQSHSSRCSRCASQNDLHLVTLLYDQETPSSRLLVYCFSCRQDFSAMIDVSIPIRLVTADVLRYLYAAGKTTSDPQTVVDVILCWDDHRLVQELKRLC